MPEKEGFLKQVKNGLLSFPAYISLYYNCNKRFNQERITTASYIWSFFDKEFPILDERGVCNGLALDYARHTIKHSKEDSRSDPDYLSKLKGKFTLFGESSQNFARRIDQYQDKLQVSSNADAQYKELEGGLDGNFQNKIPKDIKVIGLTFNSPSASGGKKRGHIIVIHKIVSENITSYRVFDPNFGEYNCSDEKKLNATLNGLNNYYKLEGLTGNLGIANLENVVIQSGLIEQSDDKYLDDKVVTTTGGMTQYRSKDEQIEKLKKLIEETTPNVKEISKIIASVDIPTDFNLAKKLPESFFKSFLSTDNYLPSISREQADIVSERMANNLMRICKITEPTERLAQLITEGKVRSVPDLVVKLVEQGANLESKTYKAVFQKHFKTTANCKKTAIYAIEQGNIGLLETLKSKEYCGESLSFMQFDNKSLLKIAAKKNPDLALKMIHAGFTLHSEEMGGVHKTTGAILNILGLDQEKYTKIVLENEFTKFLEEKKLTKISPEREQMLKGLYEAKIKANIAGNSSSEEKTLNTEVAQIQADQSKKTIIGSFSNWWCGTTSGRQSSVERPARSSNRH